jgi:hypothetical protein
MLRMLVRSSGTSACGLQSGAWAHARGALAKMPVRRIHASKHARSATKATDTKPEGGADKDKANKDTSAFTVTSSIGQYSQEFSQAYIDVEKVMHACIACAF